MSNDLEFKPMRPNPNDFVLFNEVVPHKKYPRYVNMQKPDKIFATNNALENGPEWVRDYWNGKNLRKRKT